MMQEEVIGAHFENCAREKEEELRFKLRRAPQLIVAFSGGVDSSYLTYVAHEELGRQMLAVLGVGSSLAENERKRAIQFLKTHAIPYRTVETSEWREPDYVRNDEHRCYYCKKALFQICEEIKNQQGWQRVAYGFTADDERDFRPGQSAADEYRVWRPLYDVGMTKAEIRNRSENLGLADFDRPAQPCLASRLAYGTEVTKESLGVVESMENCLAELGFKLCRARYDGTTLRIEVASGQVHALIQDSVREEIVKRAFGLGVSYVSLDLEGFVSGKSNRVLLKEKNE